MDNQPLNAHYPSISSDESDDQEVVKRFDSLQAFFILFAVSFGPTFIALNLSIDDQMNPWADVILILVIGVVFVFNLISVDMLT
jgi:heme/copper-type cytochrome/quinol oxidase subunit 4